MEERNCCAHFCNSIVDDLEEEKEIYPKAGINIKRKLAERIKEWKEKLHEALIRKGVDKKIVKRIPVVPAGIASSLSLPGYKYWLSNMFNKALDRMRHQAMCAYILLNEGRIISAEEVDPKKMAETEIQDQPIVEVATGVGVAVTGAAVGAGVGATIGALAIGIPSFGVFAGGGLVLGGAIGAAIGTVSGVGTGMLMRWYKKMKRKKLQKGQ